MGPFRILENKMLESYNLKVRKWKKHRFVKFFFNDIHFSLFIGIEIRKPIKYFTLKYFIFKPFTFEHLNFEQCSNGCISHELNDQSFGGIWGVAYPKK